MGISKLLSQGGIIAIIGLVIVFVLLVIWWLLKGKNVSDKAPKAAEAVSVKKEINNDEELVAVISAAIAASLNTSTYNLRITSLKRVNNWKNVARQESIF